jgi:hypothetical protein
MKKEHLIILAAFVVGVMASGKVRTLPGFKSLPSF